MLNYAHIYLATIMLKLCQHNLPRPICSTVAETENTCIGDLQVTLLTTAIYFFPV